MKPPPTSVQVADLVYSIKPFPLNSTESAELYGVCDNQASVIHYAKNQTDDRMQNTVLHETFHACWNRAGLKDKDKEERIVTCMANVFIQVIRENPELMDWLGEKV